MSAGFFVFSSAGRDKGRCFVVMQESEEFYSLADGKLRRVEKPKKKKKKHTSATGEADDMIRGKLTEDAAYSGYGPVTNREIKKAISKFLEGGSANG